MMKEKDLYSTLNEMELFSNFLQGKVYVRTCDVETLQKKINELEGISKVPVGQLLPEHTDKFPTHF
jgi:hypothetical protein